MGYSIISHNTSCFVLLSLLLIFVPSQAVPIPITILESAVAQGAVCLDGSPPAYFLEQGDPQKWLIMIEGGGWCESVKSCLDRSTTFRGSSKYFNKTTGFSGSLSGAKANNPDFWDFTRVKIKYCDGASLTGDVEEVDPTTNLHYRGQRIWDAVMADLLAKGMKNAKFALLTGCSAGSLAAVLHCDEFRALFPTYAVVKCVPDAGYFVNGLDLVGKSSIGEYFSGVVNLHGSAKTLPKSCTAQMAPVACFFPQYAAKFIQTPLFIINSAYDTYQIGHVLAPAHVDPTQAWSGCRLDIAKCSAAQLAQVQGFRDQFVAAIQEGAAVNPRNGFFIISCYTHCITSVATNWIGPQAVKLRNTDVGKAVGDWFFDRLVEPFRVIDPPYPSNPTCPKIATSL